MKRLKRFRLLKRWLRVRQPRIRPFSWLWRLKNSFYLFFAFDKNKEEKPYRSMIFLSVSFLLC